MQWITDRLIIRNWNPVTDAEQAFAIYGDAEVMHFIRPPDVSVAVTQQRLEALIAHYKRLDNGTGAWAMEEQATREIAGCVLLKQLPDNEGNPTDDYEVGWHLRKVSWGKGYATEAAKAALLYGFQTLKLSVIYAVVKPENHASIRVTQRLEMLPLGRVDRYYGVELELFKLEAAEFFALQEN